MVILDHFITGLFILSLMSELFKSAKGEMVRMVGKCFEKLELFISLFNSITAIMFFFLGSMGSSLPFQFLLTNQN